MRSPCIALGIALALPLAASAHTVADFTLLSPELSVRLIAEGFMADLADSSRNQALMADGSLLFVLEPNAGAPGDPLAEQTLLRRLALDGQWADLATFPPCSRAPAVEGCEQLCYHCIAWVAPDPAGGIWIAAKGQHEPQLEEFDHWQFWRIEGLPIAYGKLPGDVSPGVLSDATQPPTWHIEGNEIVDVSDVLTVLRAAVGLEQLSCAPPPAE